MPCQSRDEMDIAVRWFGCMFSSCAEVRVFMATCCTEKQRYYNVRLT